MLTGVLDRHPIQEASSALHGSRPSGGGGGKGVLGVSDKAHQLLWQPDVIQRDWAVEGLSSRAKAGMSS